jgi:hypothetical protein
VVANQLKISKKVWNEIKQDLQEQKDSIIKLAQELLLTTK